MDWIIAGVIEQVGRWLFGVVLVAFVAGALVAWLVFG